MPSADQDERIRQLERLCSDLRRQSAGEILALAESLPVMAWMSGADRKCTWCSSRWLAFTGRTLEQEQGDGWMAGVHPEDRPRCIATRLASHEARRPFAMEYRLRHHAGGHRRILDLGAPRTDAAGAFQGYTGCCLDVEDDRRREEDLATRNRELQRTAERLRRYARLSAQDLQEPLRTISLALDVVRRDERAGLGQRERELLEQAAAAALRMREVTAAVASFGRIGDSGVRLEDVQLDACLSAAIAELHERLAAGDAAIVREPLPRVRGVAEQLTLAFAQLLGNAMRYRSQRPPRIAVRCRGDGDAWEIAVSDNGIGIDPARRDQVVEPFGRGDRSAPGAGMGLAIVREIVEHHGGELRIDGNTDGGTTVTLRIPRDGAAP